MTSSVVEFSHEGASVQRLVLRILIAPIASA